MKLLLLLVAAAIADPIFLYTPTPTKKADLLPQTAPDGMYVIRERFAKMDMSALFGLGDLTFNLFDDVVLEVVNANVEKNQHGFYLWEGKVKGADWSTVTMTFNDEMVMGHIQADARVYMIRPIEHAVKIIEIDQSSFPPEAEPILADEIEEGQGDGYVWPNTPRPDTGIELLQADVVDILHLEPAPSQAACGGLNLPAIESQYQNHLNSVWGSQYGVQSRVMARCFIRNVTNNFSGELSNLANSAGVAQARNDLGADLVALVMVASGSICGIAYRPNIPISQGNQGTAFSVDARSCAIPNWTYAHEFGHNFGLNHDRFMTGGGASACNFGGFNDYNAPTTRSIMSYNNRCSQVYNRSCQRLGTYSNGQTLGRTCPGTSTGEDCRRDFLRGAPIIANYR